MNPKKIAVAFVAAMTLLAGGLATASVATATGNDECVPSEGSPAVEATYETEYQYVKEVRGDVQKKVGNHWTTVDTFGWEPWVGGSTKWSTTNAAVLETGAHSAVQAEWTEGPQGQHKYRKVTTEYRYVPTGETRQGKELTPYIPAVDPVVCPELEVAEAEVSTVPATCESGEILSYEPEGVFSQLSGTPSGTVGPAEYVVYAVADEGVALFPGGLSEITFEGTLAGPLTGAQCDPEKPVVPATPAPVVTAEPEGLTG